MQTTAGTVPSRSRLGHSKPLALGENALFTIRNRRHPAPSTSRRARPRLATLQARTTAAHRLVNTLGQAIDHTDNLPSLREAPNPTAEVIFHQYASRIYNLARRMLSNDADAEDVTQNVLLQVVRKLDTFRGASDLFTWLHRVTVNAALAHRRKQAPQLALEASTSLREMEDRGRPVSSLSPWGAEPDKQLLDREMKECIEEAVRRLPGKYRDPFVLSCIEEMPNAEIGELLGLSVPAVKSRLHRARLLLRDALRPHCEEAHRQGDACLSAAADSERRPVRGRRPGLCNNQR
jgi:RNA polymerase sigma-70 factor (ECF subfamily)